MARVQGLVLPEDYNRTASQEKEFQARLRLSMTTAGRSRGEVPIDLDGGFCNRSSASSKWHMRGS